MSDAMDGISNPRNIVDAIKLSISTASVLYHYANDVKNAKSDMTDLSREIGIHLAVLEKARDLLENQSGRLEVSQELRPALDANYSELENIKLQLDKDLGDTSSVRKRVSNRLRWPSQKHKIQYNIERLRKTREDIGNALSIDSANTIMDIRSIQSDEILSKLPVVQSASFDSHANEHEPQCHPDTRIKILGEIEKWAQEPKGRRIYWLCGMAGTGKSTICRTIAHHLTNLNIATASFFFKKGDNDRDKSSALFTTIVKQLVEQLPNEMALHVKKALQDNPSIGDKVLSKQFEKLILEPLKSCKSLPPVIIIVLDALDECEDQASAAKIIELLPGIETVASTCFKVLVASRPQCHLRTSFAQLECKYHEIFLYEALHEVPDEDIRQDISIVLKFQLGQIRDNYNLTNPGFLSDWPSESLVKELVDVSVPLFIAAATACRFIGNRRKGGPKKLALEFMQRHRQLGKMNHLARIYLPVLEQLLVDRSGAVSEELSKADKEDMIMEFCQIVGSIVLLEAPLSITSLSEILEKDPEDVELLLSNLNSVLNVPRDSNSPVKLFHLSFRDFLVGTGDQDQKHDFLVDERETHANLARQCIALLSRGDNLRQDICGLNHPGKLRSSIDQDTIDNCLPPHVRYACLYWVFHLKESRGRIQFDDETHHFLTKHLIHWLEALSLLGRIAESGEMVESLLAMVDNNDGAFGLLRDTKRFVRAYQHIVDVAPLQIYSSALIFAPKRCEFRQCFEEAIPKWIKRQPTVPMDWDPCLQTLEGHKYPVIQAVLSPDSSLIASRSTDDILIWRSQAGTCIYELHVRAKAMAFSRDSKLFYTVLSDGEIAAWKTDTWTRKAIMRVESPTGDAHVRDAAISHDGKLVAVKFGKSFEIRSISTPGEFTKSIEHNAARTDKLLFSPDSAYFAAVNHFDELLEVWRIRGEKRAIRGGCSAAAYSPDSCFMALAFNNAIKIYNIDNGSLKFHRKFLVKDEGRIFILNFSHDAALLAIALRYSKFGIWSTKDGSCIWTANDHTSFIQTVLFSHDSAFLVSASADKTLRIYAVDNRQPLEVHERKHGKIDQITISPDSSLILREPGRGNKMWKILRADSSICVRKFDQAKLQIKPIFTHDSSLAVIQNGAAETWHPDRHKSVQILYGLGPDPSRIHVACFSADCTLVAGILDDRSLRIWQINTGECIREVKTAVPEEYSPNILGFSSDASRIACASEGKKDLFVWQVESDALAKKFIMPDKIICFALSDTKLAVSLSREMMIWSLERGEILQHCEGYSAWYIHKISISYDSMLVVSATSITIALWNADTGAHVQTIYLDLEITHLSFEPNDNSGIFTNLGRIKFKNFAASSEDAASISQLQSWYYYKLHIAHSVYGQNDGGSWITFNGEKLLWLPIKYRGGSHVSRAVSDSVVAITNNLSRQHTFIAFDTDKIPRWYHDIYT